MKLHPRHQPMTRAELDIRDAIGKAVQDHNLTFAELWHVLSMASASWAKGAIKEERKSAQDGDQ